MGDVESFGASSGPANDAALNHVADLLRELVPGAFTQRFVLIVEAVDEDDRFLCAFTAPGQKAWDTLGMLAWGKILESNVSVSRDDDEDD